MNNLKNKKILIGVTGSIAAYKAVILTRLLVKAGAVVKVVMTDAAKTFVAPLTFSTLSKNPVYSAFTESDDGLWNNHVELGLWADVLLIAPATANTLAKMSNGICDNLLSAVYLSAKCPVLVAPAMDLDMWLHPSTKNNIKKIESFGNKVIPVGDGELASGLHGAGRLAEPEAICEYLDSFFGDSFNQKENKETTTLKGKKVLITAGPTQESLDPVRFISNHSSGKMGISIAEAALARGAEVYLVLGPSNLKPLSQEINVSSVKSAEDMFNAVDKEFDSSDLIIMAAAVADFTPITTSDKKIKKSGKGNMMLELTRTKDILKTMGGRKKAHQMLVGFALETNNEIENATRKLNSKNLDFIVLNSMREKGAGFKHATNRITILDKYNKITKFELKSKDEVALDILSYAEKMSQN